MNTKKINCHISRSKKIYKIKTTDEFLTLMNIYYSEWEHRDSIMWQQAFKFFFISFITMLLPFCEIWGITLDEYIPEYIFPICGLIFDILFLYVSIQYARRLSYSGKTYRNMIAKLPVKFQREKIQQNNKINIHTQLAYTIPLIMFIALFILGVTLLILSLKSKI